MRRLWITLLRAACGDDDVIMDASVDTARDATNLETDANEGFDAGCTRDEDCPLSGGTGQGAPLMASDIDMIGGQGVLLGYSAYGQTGQGPGEDLSSIHPSACAF